MSSNPAKLPLSELLELIIDHRGKTPNKMGFDDFFLSGVPVLSAKHVKTDGLVDVQSMRYASAEMYKKWMKVEVQEGDIILTSEAPMGEVFYIQDDKKYVLGQRVFGLRPNPRLINPKYLTAWLASSKGQRQIAARASGSTVQGIRQSELLKLEVDLPSKEEQEIIANVRFSLTDKLSLNRSINQTLEAMAQAIFKSWFVDFDPVKAKIAAIEQGEDPQQAAMRAISGKTDAELDQMPREHHDQLAITAALFPDAMEDAAQGSANATSAERAGAASELGEIPKGWEVVPLSKMIRLIGGGTPKRSEPSYWGGTIPWFSVKDVPNDGDVWVVDTDEKITEAGLQKSSTKLLRKGTTIISARGTVGKLALVGQEMAMNQSCYGVVGTDGVGDFFNYFNLKFAVEILKRNTHGAVFDTITQATFETVTCVKPGNSVMKQFDEIVEPLLKGIRSNVFQSRELAELRDTLLPKLLSGELSVDLVAEENVQ